MANVWKSLPSHPVSKILMIKNGFYGRYEFKDSKYGLHDMTYDKKMPLKKALAVRGKIMEAALMDKLNVLEALGINIFKQVEMISKYQALLPLVVWEDELWRRR